MTSSKGYMLHKFWREAPVLTTNLLDIGLVNNRFNANLTRSAVAAFDQFTSTRLGTRKIPSSSTPDSGRRRRRRSPPISSSNSGMTTSPEAVLPTASNGFTENDFFFEHQRTRGYRLATESIANCDSAKRLQDNYLVDIVAYYLEHVCGAKPLAELLVQGTGEISIDMWAAIQQGEGAHHAFHVHEGSLVSGVYYASVPPGSAPLVLRGPKLDERDQISMTKESSSSDVVLSPSEGNLVVFPPWVEHGVPLVEDQDVLDASELPRISYAFNVTATVMIGSHPWDITRTQ